MVALVWLVHRFEVEVFYLLFFVALNHVLISIVAYLRSNVSGVGMYRTDSLISTLDKVFLIALCAVLLWANPFSEGEGFQIKWFVHAQNIPDLIVACHNSVHDVTRSMLGLGASCHSSIYFQRTGASMEGSSWPFLIPDPGLRLWLFLAIGCVTFLLKPSFM